MRDKNISLEEGRKSLPIGLLNEALKKIGDQLEN